MFFHGFPMQLTAPPPTNSPEIPTNCSKSVFHDNSLKEMPQTSSRRRSLFKRLRDAFSLPLSSTGGSPPTPKKSRLEVLLGSLIEVLVRIPLYVFWESVFGGGPPQTFSLKQGLWLPGAL